jgi:hypothetical protein
MAMQREKVEQAHGVQLLRYVAGREQVFVLGTRRRAGDYQGTMQSLGVPDVVAFLPLGPSKLQLWWEVKAPGGRLRPEQQHFRQLCLSVAAGVAHVVGDYDALIAFLVKGGWVKASSLPHYRQPKDADRSPQAKPDAA